jgi:hypothetical protein
MAETCAHPPCTCAPNGDDPFCSETCRLSVEQKDDRCSCGHDDCAGTELQRIEGRVIEA